MFYEYVRYLATIECRVRYRYVVNILIDYINRFSFIWLYAIDSITFDIKICYYLRIVKLFCLVSPRKKYVAAFFRMYEISLF